MKIRKAEIKDLTQIYELIASATKRGKILKRPLEELRGSIHHFWVIEERGSVIACCAFEIYNKKLSEIRSLVVDQRRQKKGLGTLLVRQCLKEAKKKKVYEVLAVTDRLSLFKRLGFAEQLHGQKPLFIKTRGKA